MKSVQRIKKVQLKVNPSGDFSLIGIVSAEPDYKLSLAINKKLKINLKNSDPLKIDADAVDEFSFSRFTFHDDPAELTYILISNRCGQGCLIRKLKNIDFFMQLHHPEISPEEASRIISSVREVQGVTAIFNLTAEELKDKNFRYLTF